VTLNLILMRHAKSSWEDPALDDHARPLNGRGRRGAAAIGAWLAEQGLRPEEVLSSDSQRTRETWAQLSAGWPGAPAPRWQRALYHADVPEMLAALQAAEAPSVMLIGHNPGIACLAHHLAADAPAHDRWEDVPTAATWVADLTAPSWDRIAPHSARTRAFIVPRDLGVT
jgi:phosphohistidine phosphatase